MVAEAIGAEVDGSQQLLLADERFKGILPLATSEPAFALQLRVVGVISAGSVCHRRDDGRRKIEFPHGSNGIDRTSDRQRHDIGVLLFRGPLFRYLPNSNASSPMRRRSDSHSMRVRVTSRVSDDESGVNGKARSPFDFCLCRKTLPNRWLWVSLASPAIAPTSLRKFVD